MKHFPKESRKINLILNQKPLHKNFNKPLYRNNSLKSQDDMNQFERNDLNTFYSKNTPKNPTFNKNIFIKNTIKKLNKKSINELISPNKIPITRPINFLHGSMTTKNKKLVQSKSISIEQGNDVGRVTLTNTLYDDIKIRNIISLWNELEVMESYRKYFFFIYKEIDEDDKKNFYQNEINELIQLKNDIKNLTYNIELRFGIIKILSELNEELNKEMKSKEKKDIDKYVINDMIKKLEDLTIQTVNIVIYMKKIKTVINLAPNLGKYDMDLLAHKFNFDKNYVIKMKLETNFLKEGYAKELFDIKDDQSPFFIRANNKIDLSNNEKETYTISLDQKVLNSIKECNYYIYKELIAYENDKANKKIFRCISPIRKNAPSYNFYTNINFFSNVPDKKRETKVENLHLNFKPNGKGFIFNRNDNTFNNRMKRIDNLKMNNSARLVPGFDLFNNNSNNNKDSNKILSFDKKVNSIYKPRNKNSDFDNFHSEYNNNLYDPNINKSEIISPNIIDSSKSKQVISSLDFPKGNDNNNLKENKNEQDNPES